ncbi:MAG: hypothetical protein JO368_02715, partial [Acidimicrobiales bacterium]|nr:hypothetical protein [Acidimicrobiales bacterium]
ITGAPSGFSAIAGVGGCPVTTKTKKLTAACPNPPYTFGNPGGAYSLALSPGKWDVAGFYELAPFGGQFLSAIAPVTITGGTITTVNFTVPYAAPASVTSTITVTNVPSGVSIEEDLLLACPTIAPYTGGTIPIECVGGSASPGQPASIKTLPPGKWLLYPGYLTVTSETVGTTPTEVKLTAGQSVTKNLTINYSG